MTDMYSGDDVVLMYSLYPLDVFFFLKKNGHDTSFKLIELLFHELHDLINDRVATFNERTVN